MKRLGTNQGNKRGPIRPVKHDIDNCPVCGKPRGNGVVYIDHGPCAEKMAHDTSEQDKKRVKKQMSRKRSDLAYWMSRTGQ